MSGADIGLQTKVGLINSAGKYLTAETFGFKINASSATFRKKQLWTIEPDTAEADTVYVKSHLGRYLSGDKKVYRLNDFCCQIFGFEVDSSTR
jgi:hypothetical protein